jgi:methylenetetrahydrofolate reductase (NADPH)
MASMIELKLTHRVKFMMALSTLPSASEACRLRDSGNGVPIPESIIARMEQASDPEGEGIEICAELLRELASIPGVSGVNLMTTGRLASIPAAIEASGLSRT